MENFLGDDSKVQVHFHVKMALVVKAQRLGRSQALETAPLTPQF